MPTYLPPVNGVAYSAAYAEAMAVAPNARAMLETLEFLHPDLAAPIRLVLNTSNITATLEAGAPANAGTAVLFTAVRLGLTRPQESDDGAPPEASFWIDGVSTTVAAQMEPVTQSLEPVTVIWRTYASDDLAGPANLPPDQLEVTGVSVDETRVTCTARFGNTASTRFPGKSFLPSEYPALAAQ